MTGSRPASPLWGVPMRMAPCFGSRTPTSRQPSTAVRLRARVNAPASPTQPKEIWWPRTSCMLAARRCTTVDANGEGMDYWPVEQTAGVTNRRGQTNRRNRRKPQGSRKPQGKPQGSGITFSTIYYALAQKPVTASCSGSPDRARETSPPH